jgi:hypothetical protein
MAAPKYGNANSPLAIGKVLRARMMVVNNENSPAQAHFWLF